MTAIAGSGVLPVGRFVRPTSGEAFLIADWRGALRVVQFAN